MNRRRDEQLMSPVRSAGFLIVLLTAGCAGMDRAPQGVPPEAGAVQEKAPAPEPQGAVSAKPAPAAPKQDVPVAVEPVSKPAPPPTTASTNQSAARPEAPAAKPETVDAKPEAPAAKPQASAEKPQAKAPASPARKEPAPTKESAAPPAPKPAPPTLDLAALEKRLKETSAIGVFTKLTLKNQVDALLDQFRAYYQGRIKTTLAQLRQPYEQLLMKVLSLLQDSDPPLARDIVQSREAIWGILSDPEKFKNL